jgi:hypothetical protein
MQELAPIVPAKTESLQQLQQDLDALHKSLQLGRDEVRGRASTTVATRPKRVDGVASLAMPFPCAASDVDACACMCVCVCGWKHVFVFASVGSAKGRSCGRRHVRQCTGPLFRRCGPGVCVCVCVGTATPPCCAPAVVTPPFAVCTPRPTNRRPFLFVLPPLRVPAPPPWSALFVQPALRVRRPLSLVCLCTCFECGACVWFRWGVGGGGIGVIGEAGAWVCIYRHGNTNRFLQHIGD